MYSRLDLIINELNSIGLNKLGDADIVRKIISLQVEDLLFNIDKKKQRKRGCFACGEKGHFRDSCPNMVEPTKGRSKGKTLTSVKTWDDFSSEDEPPRTRSH